MRKDYDCQHETQVKVQLEHCLLRFLFQSALLLLDVALLSIHSPCNIYTVALIILVIHLFKGFTVPVAEFEHCGGGSDYDEEVDNEDQHQQ